MGRRVFGVILSLLLLSWAACAQDSAGYVDVLTVKVKPEKRTEFNDIVKKMAEANRQNKGDVWLASETTYGEGNTVYFTTMRKNYAAIDHGMELFMGALSKAFGKEETASLMQDFSSCIVSDRSEIRRRRTDLSPNMPADAAWSKLVGESRWSRVSIVRIRPGHSLEYEEQLKIIKAAVEKADPNWVNSVAQSSAGQQGTVFYITTLRSSLGGFDSAPSLRNLLGEEGYQKYMHVVAESVLSSETIINRFLPQLSNVPSEIASAAPEFWRPEGFKTTTAP